MCGTLPLIKMPNELVPTMFVHSSMCLCQVLKQVYTCIVCVFSFQGPGNTFGIPFLLVIKDVSHLVASQRMYNITEGIYIYIILTECS